MTSNNATPMSLDSTDLVPSQAEMTDGITTTNRLEEIISAIATANPNSSSEGIPSHNPNCNDISTHWYSLVNAVAATSDEECIRHFVEKLNGLALITDWTHVAQKLDNEFTVDDANNGSSDKLIVLLLDLLNRLPLETYMLADGGMLSVLDELGLSKSSTIKEKALALHDKWRPAEVGAASSHLTNSNIPETSESLKDEPQEPNCSTNQDVSGCPMKGKTAEDEEEEEAKEQMNSPSDPGSPAYSSDTGSMPDNDPVVSPSEKEKVVEAVYDDDMDALEIARQVAIQVEEEVVQYRETLCSSPEEEIQPVGVDLPLTKPTQVKSDKNAVERVCSTPHRDEGAVLTTGAQEEGQVKASKADGSGLDLNENLCADYENSPELIHVAASKGVPPSSIPVCSSRFGAGIAAGWTGTAAATSAFRPASTCSAPHPSADRSGTGIPAAESVGQKQKFFSCLAFEFDLNVAGTNAAEVTLPPPGNSSIEVSSERAKRVKLDLNCANEDEVLERTPSQLPQQVSSHIFREHGHSASSSSSRNQVKFDFDLNDDLSYRKDEGQSGNSVKLMGWNMNGGTVPRNQTTPPMFHSFLGPNAAPSQFGSLSGPANLYHSHMAPSSSYGYQYNVAPLVWYGQPSTSYAVPPHFVPQMLGPVSQNGPPPVGLSLMPGDRSNFLRPSLDLNASTGSVEVTSREVRFRPLFMQNHSGPVQEPVATATAQPAVQTPGNGVRWREQEQERETFSYSFKQPI